VTPSAQPPASGDRPPTRQRRTRQTPGVQSPGSGGIAEQTRAPCPEDNVKAVNDDDEPTNLEKHGETGDDQAVVVPADLSFQQARTALDLMIGHLQASDLEVEEMVDLYRRAQAYAAHCEALLQRVDQDVIEWDVLQDSRETSS